MTLGTVEVEDIIYTDFVETAKRLLPQLVEEVCVCVCMRVCVRAYVVCVRTW